ELKLFRSGVADAYRRRLFVAGKPGNFGFIEPAFTTNAVHDLHLCRAPSDSSQQPLAPSCGFLTVTGAQQGEQSERGIPKPAVAIIPVARTSDLFGQRCRRSSDQPTGGSIG